MRICEEILDKKAWPGSQIKDNRTKATKGFLFILYYRAYIAVALTLLLLCPSFAYSWMLKCYEWSKTITWLSNLRLYVYLAFSFKADAKKIPALHFHIQLTSDYALQQWTVATWSEYFHCGIFGTPLFFMRHFAA